MRNKLFLKNKLLLLILLGIIISSFAVEAGVLDDASNLLLKLWDFEPTYNKNPRAWDFIFFALIFNTIAWFGLIKAFPDNKVAAYILAGVIGAVLGLAAVKAGMSMEFFIPIVKNFFYIIIVGLIFYILGYIFEMNKFLAFILAIVIAFFAFNVLGLFESVDVSKEVGRLLPDPSMRDIDQELYDMASYYSISLTGTNSTRDRLNKIRPILDKKLSDVDSNSEEYKKINKDRNRLIFLEQRIQFLLDEEEIEKNKELADRLKPFKDKLSDIDLIADPVKRLQKINELLIKVDKRLKELESDVSSRDNNRVTVASSEGNTEIGREIGDENRDDTESSDTSSIADIENEQLVDTPTLTTPEVSLA